MLQTELLLRDFEYELPPELIAQAPADRRDSSRLFVLDRARGAFIHDHFHSIGRHLQPGDILVANRSRVIPARLFAHKETGGSVELLLLRHGAGTRWLALARPSRRLREGAVLRIPGSDLIITLLGRDTEGQWEIELSGVEDTRSEIERVGIMPLPPYIHGPASPDRYQTVYADRDGSVAAPTAGLHFSQSLLAELEGQGVKTYFITLHVGLGTFRPVTEERVAAHRMHPEWGEVPSDVVDAVRAARQAGRRVVAVGTTTTRLLEIAAESGTIEEFRGETSHFIYPGYRFRVVDALITNFHLPRSTLLMLVSAFAGRELILRAYHEAIQQRYRFYSFGDAMLIV